VNTYGWDIPIKPAPLQGLGATIEKYCGTKKTGY